jgi:GNAT superfamily N-acetyltransferase
LGTTTVATIGPVVVGFVALHDDEVEQLYVDAAARGTGVAAALLAHGESVIGATHDRAWLAVVPGNARARRFYELAGWVADGTERASEAFGVSFAEVRYRRRSTSEESSSATPEGTE